MCWELLTLKGKGQEAQFCQVSKKLSISHNYCEQQRAPKGNPILPQGSRNKSTGQWNTQHVERKYQIQKRLIKGTAWQELTGFYSVYPGRGLLPFVKLSFAEHRQISVHGHKDTPHLLRAINLCDLTMIKAKVPLAQVKEHLLPRTLHFRHYSTD